MLAKIIKYITLKTKTMTKHVEKKHENKKHETSLQESIEKLNEENVVITKEEFNENYIFENEIDMVKFASDMNNAFLNSNQNLKAIKKQLNLNSEHFISITIVENERLLAIIENFELEKNGK